MLRKKEQKKKEKKNKQSISEKLSSLYEYREETITKVLLGDDVAYKLPKPITVRRCDASSPENVLFQIIAESLGWERVDVEAD